MSLGVVSRVFIILCRDSTVRSLCTYDAVVRFELSLFFFLMIRRPPRSTLDRSSAASDVYKRQRQHRGGRGPGAGAGRQPRQYRDPRAVQRRGAGEELSLIHISEPTRPY